MQEGTHFKANANYNFALMQAALMDLNQHYQQHRQLVSEVYLSCFIPEDGSNPDTELKFVENDAYKRIQQDMQAVEIEIAQLRQTIAAGFEASVSQVEELGLVELDQLIRKLYVP
jgi:hypothetical protein